MQSGIHPGSKPTLPMSIDAVTRSVETHRLQKSGIANLRVLDETSFRTFLERLVEERVRARLAESLPAAAPSSPPAGDLASLREEYQKMWDEHRARVEEKLRLIEEKAIAAFTGLLPDAASPPLDR